MEGIQRKPGPDYDLAATREAFLASGRKFRPWARLKNLDPDSFGRMMSGTYLPVSGGELERRILAALAEDGLLVLKKNRTVRKSARCGSAQAA